MPIEIIENGDIFTPCDSDIIVNPVNTVGVMGKGLAREFRLRYPGIWEPYKEKCRDGWKIGEILTLSNSTEEFPKWIVCFPTKRNWHGPAYLWLIEKGMPAFFDEIIYTGAHAISLPALGCGLGGLKWSVVEKYLTSLPWPEFLRVRIFYPHDISLEKR